MEVFSNGAWFLYSDLKEYKLKGKDALSPDDRSIVARWVLFLKSDFEYAWPSATFKEWLLKVISCSAFGQSTLDKWHETGDVYFWPFLSNNQLNEAKQKYGYLGIQNTSVKIFDESSYVRFDIGLSACAVIATEAKRVAVNNVVKVFMVIFPFVLLSMGTV